MMAMNSLNLSADQVRERQQYFSDKALQQTEAEESAQGGDKQQRSVLAIRRFCLCVHKFPIKIAGIVERVKDNPMVSSLSADPFSPQTEVGEFFIVYLFQQRLPFS